MTYHYTESGLDNVYLEDGYTIHETPYGEGVSIHDTPGLHMVIGEWMIKLPKPVNGAELRFLRLEMEMTQRDLASILGTTEQSLRLWEKKRNKAMPTSPDRLLRAVYSEFIGGDGSVRDMVNRLAELNQVDKVEAYFNPTDRGWQVQDDLSV